jgi:hypothetical protein
MAAAPATTSGITISGITTAGAASSGGPIAPAAQTAGRDAGLDRSGAPSASARFSACGRYRWWLERCWDSRLPTLLFIGLNPSRADAERDDPTLRRLQSFARAWGFGRLEVVNLFARVAASPALLRRCVDPVGPDNDRQLIGRLEALRAEPRRGQPGDAAAAAGAAAAAIWLGWGNGGAWRGRDREVLQLLHRAMDCGPARGAAWGPASGPVTRPDAWTAAPALLVVGLTASGQPRHPLYVPGDAQPLPLLHPGSEFSVGTRP